MQPSQITEANKTRSDEVARRAMAAIGEMQANGERISFYSVAKRAQVARSTLYRRSDLRCLIEEARGGEATVIPGRFDAAFDIERLEEELASVRKEKDELVKAMREMQPVRYCLVDFVAAA